MISEKPLLHQSAIALWCLLNACFALSAEQLPEEIWPVIEEPGQVDAHEGFIDVNGVQLWYWDTGGEGDAIVLSHPGSQSSLVWTYQQPVFANAGYRVIAWSRRGHFRSETGSDENRGTAVNDMLALLDKLEVEQAHLLGAAAGGISAMAFAVRYPERTRSLILASSIVSPDEDEWREMFGRLEMNRAREFMSPEFLELSGSYRAGNHAGTTRFAALAAQATPQGRVSQPSGVTVNWSTMEALPVPVLLLTGEADLYAPPSLLRLFKAHLNDAELVLIREAGHAAYWEQPQVFNQAVLDFVQRH